MKKIGIIDVGSNSMRLVIFEVSTEGWFFTVEDIKETVRLGEGVNIDGRLKEEKIELGYKTMALFKDICFRHGVDRIIAFGTAAVRIAKNSHIFLERVSQELGIEIEVFSGETEALNSFKGAISSLDIQDGVVMDLGGSSLEIVVFKDRVPVKSISLPFGGVTVGEIADLKDNLKKDDEEKLRDFIRENFSKVEWKSELKSLNLIGVGGTVRNIASIHSNLFDFPLDNLHNYRMSQKDVEKVVDYVKNKKYKEKVNIPGLSKSRADLFTGSLIIVEEFLDYFQMKELVISSYGIREGVLYNRVLNRIFQNENVFHESLANISNRLGINAEEKIEIYRNFMKIYDSLKEHYDIKILNEKIIKVITYLENVGKYINYHSYYYGSSYFIMHVGIMGMEIRDLIISSLIVARGGEKTGLLKSYSPLVDEEDLSEILIAAKILNISRLFIEILGISSNDFNVTVEEKSIVFTLGKNREKDLSVIDLYISQKKFINSFDRKIIFETER